MSATNPPTKKYRGNCHCGAFVFELDVPEIKSVSDCDCSICHKKGYLWLRPENPPTVVKDEGDNRQLRVRPQDVHPRGLLLPVRFLLIFF